MRSRAALAGVLGALLALGPAATAAAGPSSPLFTATVFAPNGTSSTDSVSLAQLQADAQQCPQYAESSMNELSGNGWRAIGLPSAGPQTGTWSLAAVLGCLSTPIPESAVTGITIINSNGLPESSAASQISPGDLASPSDFNDPNENPVLEDLGSVVQYDRPWRGGSDQDFDDEVQDNPPIDFEVFEGPLLTVSATPARVEVRAGTAERFTATVSGNDGSPLTYSWDFDGAAANSSAADPDVTFATAGTWTASLQVTDATGGGGTATIPVTVTSSANVPPNHSSSPTGPARSQGKSHGARPGSRDGSGAGTPTTPTGSAAPSHSTATTTTASPAATTTPAAPGSGTTSQPATGTTRRSAARHTGGRSAHRGPLPSGLGSPTAPLVSGQLISDVVTLPAADSPLVERAPASSGSAVPVHRGAGSSPLGPVAAVLAVLALLGLGATRELRGQRAWPTPRAGG